MGEFKKTHIENQSLEVTWKKNNIAYSNMKSNGLSRFGTHFPWRDSWRMEQGYDSMFGW